MKVLKSKIRNKIIVFLLVIVSVFIILARPATAAFIEDAGVGGGAAAGTTEDTWKKFSQGVNATTVNVWEFTGYPLYSVAGHLIGFINGYPDANGVITFKARQNSLLGNMASLINSTYQKPVSTGQYYAYISNKFNLAAPAYAQGQGWNFLQPVLEIWTIVRNITYLFFVVIFVAIGFIIMFRSKIDSQTVASVQSALPKIIIALILVTFSYAIAGLIIDLVFLLNGIITQTFFGKSPDWTPIGKAIFAEFKNVYNTPLDNVNINVLLKVFFGMTPQIQLPNLLSGAANIGLSLIFSFVVLSTAFKLFMTMLTKYVTLIISTFISPLVFLWSAMPGQGEMSGWFKTIISSAICFPAVFLVMNIAIYISTLGGVFQPLTPFQLDLFTQKGGGAPSPLGNATIDAARLVAFGMFLLLPKIPEVIDSVLKAEKGGLVGGVMGPELTAGLRRIPVIGGLLG
jgi:hypothetical protein